MHKLSVEAPPKILVERYLIEIAKNYNVPYEPDAMVRVRTSYFLFSSLLQFQAWVAMRFMFLLITPPVHLYIIYA